jgi:hypothetical protein
MQNRYTLIALFFALLFTNSLSAQTTYLCAGEQVNLEAGANYWGTPLWEYSSDGVTWNALSDQSTFSFTLNDSNSGLYRLSYTADDCSYFSETKEIRASADSFAIRSFFSDNSIPNDADPVFWYESPDSLSEITYFVNGAIVATTNTLLQQIINPGANFELYATAVNQQGCTVFTPVYTCTVYDSAQTGNGDLQLPLSALNDGVLISSSIDSINVNANGPFIIDYSYSMGFDVVVASRPSQPVNQQLLGMTVVYDEQANFVVSSENSALAMVLTLQDITNAARVYPNQVTSYIQQSALFPSVVAAIDAQLNSAGYINYEDANLWQLVRAVGEEVVSGLFPTLFDACLVPDAPSIEIFPNHLSFNHCGINTAYFARLYDHDNMPVTNPILFLGDGQSVFENNAFNFIGNLLLTNPSTAALFEAYQARTNEKITAADLNSFILFDELTVRLTNGNGLNVKPEDDYAEAYNDFSFIASFASASLVFPKLIKEAGSVLACSYSVLEFIKNEYELSLKPIVTLSPLDATLALTQFVSSLFGAIEQCDPPASNSLFKKIVNKVSSLGQFIDIGWMAQFLYDKHTKKSQVKYTCTKVGLEWKGKLKVLSNANQPFYGVPGSLAYNDANEKPYFKIEETAVYATTDNGSILLENDYLPLTNFEGFTCSGNAYNTQRLAFSHIPNQSLGSETFFSNVEFDTNPIDLLWHFKKNAIAPNVASFNVKFKYYGEWIPMYINGLQNLNYQGIIEAPQLSIMSGSNNQQGLANSFLHNTCNVTLVGSSGRPARDCDVTFEVIQGGGTLQNYGPWPNDGESPVKIINTIYETPNYLDGSAGVKWRLGQSGTQKLKVYYKPAGIQLTTVQINASIVDEIDSTEIYRQACLGLWKARGNPKYGSTGDWTEFLLSENGSYYIGTGPWEGTTWGISWEITHDANGYYLKEYGYWNPAYDNLPRTRLTYPVTMFRTYYYDVPANEMSDTNWQQEYFKY